MCLIVKFPEHKIAILYFKLVIILICVKCSPNGAKDECIESFTPLHKA